MSENLSIWSKLEPTDPEYTKDFKRAGGFSGTSINAMYAIKKMTEQFGPMGKGWGIEVSNEQLVPAGDELLVFVNVAIWWSEITKDGKMYKHVVGPQFGGDRVITKRKDGSLVGDDEAFKKAMTDGMLKCMSYLGIGADIHLGFYDDSKYINSISREFGNESTMPKEKKATPPAPAKDAPPATLNVPDAEDEKASEISKLQKEVDEKWGLAQKHLLEKHAGDVKAARDEATKVSGAWLKDVNTKDKKAKLMATKIGLTHFIVDLINGNKK